MRSNVYSLVLLNGKGLGTRGEWIAGGKGKFPPGVNSKLKVFIGRLHVRTGGQAGIVGMFGT